MYFTVQDYFLSISDGNLIYWRGNASTVFGFMVLKRYWHNIRVDTGIVLARPLIITRLELTVSTGLVFKSSTGPVLATDTDWILSGEIL